MTRSTRIARTSFTFLDNFSNTTLRNFTTGILSIYITYHLLIFLINVSYFNTVKLIHTGIEYRDMNVLTLGIFFVVSN